MTECLSCLPCCFGNKASELATGVLKGREVCPAWRMAPGVVALAACVVGIAYCLIKKNPYLCIPFGFGGAASLYFIYLGYQYKDLQTLHQSSEEIQQSNQQLRGNVERLETANSENQRQLNEHKKLVEDLRATHLADTAKNAMQIQERDEQLASQAEQLTRSEEANRDLREQIDAMKKALDQMAAHLNTGEGNLETLRQLLTEFQGERGELTAVRNALVKALEPLQPEEYRKACDAFAKLHAEVLAAESQLPELKSLVNAQLELKTQYELLFSRAAQFFTELEIRGAALFDNLGDRADAFREVQTQFQNLLKEFRKK